MTNIITLHSAWDVDRHIVLDSADKLVLIRFSSYTSAETEAEEYSRPTQRGPTTSASTAVEGSLASSSSALSTRKHKRCDAGGVDGRVVTSVTAAALLSTNANEHYLRTRQMDALLSELAPKVCKYCTMYFVDTREVTAFNDLYELGHDRDPFAVMLFYRNRHIRVDVGTGNNNKINFFAFEDLYDFLPIVDAAYKAGRQGRSIISCDRKFSTVALRR
ncbi:spliceosomal U5 snRNP-specific protein, putative [Leishmania panamensis]|uniref:Spliceosomal U5 snRNP-specific protein, putative n=2 Tax=Leishmania guyanensis species complex TaxID=38579 RepID=A0A088SA59_LEIPA|nr:spliceosomal U5 snRNP-specific protein, putative [Leishmania panamensis]AIN98531.1 spliceosomal U5 snRNP-specific protein, putative [Leishmania panamensis]